MRRVLPILLLLLAAGGVWAFTAWRHVVPAGQVGAWLGEDRLLRETWDPGTYWRRPGSGFLALFPEGLHSFTFPDDPDYVLYDADGNPVPWRVRVSYQISPGSLDFVVRQIPVGDDWDAGGVERWARATLRERARDIASRLRGNVIERTDGQALAIALYGTLRTRGLPFQVTAEKPGDDGAEAEVGVLLVGIDAGDWIILDPLLAEGRLPNLASLIRRGARADLHTLTPMLSPLIWTSIATGVTPDQHGILDFLTQDPATGKMIPVTSTLRRVPAFWNVLTEHGISQGIVGWLATWPAESISGTLVTDRAGYLAYAAGTGGSDEGMTWPPEFAPVARGLQVEPRNLGPEFWARFIGAPPSELAGLGEGGFAKGRLDDNLALTLSTAESWTRVAQYIQREQNPRLLAVYYEMVDAVGHLVMPYAPPQREDVSDELFARYGNTLTAAIEYQDELLGQLLATRNLDRTVVIVVSDHGMKSGDARPEGSAEIEGGEAARWHRDPGILVIAGPGVESNIVLDQGVSVLDIAATVLGILGVPAPEGMRRNGLPGAFTLEGRNAYAIQTRTTPLRPEVWSPPAHTATGGGPAVTAMHNNLGLVLESEGKLAEAEREFRAALAVDPRDVNARSNLAGVLRKRGNLDEAASLYRAVLADAPDFVPAQLNAAIVEQDRDNFEAAAAGFRKVLELEPGHITAKVNLGHCLLRLGQPQEASALFNQALEQNPREANATFGLGLIAAESGDLAGAEAAFARTVELDPGHAAAARNLEQVRGLLQKQ